MAHHTIFGPIQLSMAVSNKGYFLFFRILLIFLIAVVISDFLLSQIPGSLSRLFENHIPAIVSGFFIALLFGMRVNYFSYEDEYEIIHIRSKSLIFGRFESMAQTRYEFPKRTVENVEVRKFLFQKKLIIHLRTQQGEKKIRKFDLSFVPLSKLNIVFNSLQNICLQNKSSAGSSL